MRVAFIGPAFSDEHGSYYFATPKRHGRIGAGRGTAIQRTGRDDSDRIPRTPRRKFPTALGRVPPAV